jgi:hypothetical protein
MSHVELIKTIIVYSFPVITLIGLITNSISFLIFSQKKFQNTAFSIYYRVYLVFEIFNFLCPINKMFELNFEMYLSLVSNFFCKFRYYFTYSNYAIPPSLLVIISCDRFLCIAYPSKFLFRKKISFQITMSLFAIGYNYCVYIPLWYYYLTEKINNQTNQTITKCESPGQWIELINLFQELMIPFCLMFLFTSLTLRTVFNSRKASLNNSANIKSKDMKFAVSSITINILFLILRIPYFFLLLTNNILNLFKNLNDLYIILNCLSLFFYYSYSAFNFLINYFVNSIFRKEFKIVMMPCKKNNRENNL